MARWHGKTSSPSKHTRNEAFRWVRVHETLTRTPTRWLMPCLKPPWNPRTTVEQKGCTTHVAPNYRFLSLFWSAKLFFFFFFFCHQPRPQNHPPPLSPPPENNKGGVASLGWSGGPEKPPPQRREPKPLRRANMNYPSGVWVLSSFPSIVKGLPLRREALPCAGSAHT